MLSGNDAIANDGRFDCSARHPDIACEVQNDEMLAQMPIGVIAFPGGGIQYNLADKARVVGLRLMDYRGRAGG